MNELKTILILALLAVASGCSHTINYKLTQQDRWTGPKIDRIVRVVPLTDQTVPRADKVVCADNAK